MGHWGQKRHYMCEGRENVLRTRPIIKVIGVAVGIRVGSRTGEVHTKLKQVLHERHTFSLAAVAARSGRMGGHAGGSEHIQAAMKYHNPFESAAPRILDPAFAFESTVWAFELSLASNAPPDPPIVCVGWPELPGGRAGASERMAKQSGACAKTIRTHLQPKHVGRIAKTIRPHATRTCENNPKLMRKQSE